ncbi:MAG: hypothetical protein AAB225_04115 [Acidobacteriota bacterium]
MVADRPAPAVIEVGDDLDAKLEATPDRPAVFLIWPREGAPYLARTNVLRRRLRRLLGERAQPSRLLNLRSVASRVEYWLTGSRLEASLLQYELARRHFPETCLRLLKLRMPPYVKLILSNPFPRSQVTTRLSGSKCLLYGPFRSRAAADQFQGQFLDLFQMRRCEEDLQPSPAHPGCIYGEMNMCLRPCQQVVTPEEYRSETERVAAFLSTQGRSLVETITAARDRLSEELNFEEAARQHKRLEKIHEVLRLRDELAADIERLSGVAVTPSPAPGAVELWFVLRGCWQPPVRLSFEVAEGKTVSLDHRLRELVASLNEQKAPLRTRQEHLALLARWYYSSWRDGEWLGFASLAEAPYRKMVRAISRVAGAGQRPA